MFIIFFLLEEESLKKSVSIWNGDALLLNGCILWQQKWSKLNKTLNPVDETLTLLQKENGREWKNEKKQWYY